MEATTNGEVLKDALDAFNIGEFDHLECDRADVERTSDKRDEGDCTDEDGARQAGDGGCAEADRYAFAQPYETSRSGDRPGGNSDGPAWPGWIR